MAEVLTLRVEKELRQQLDDISDAEEKDRSEVIRELLFVGIQERRVTHALDEYKGGRITLWKAARSAGVSLWRMLEILKERKIELQYGLEELRQDFTPLEG